MEIFLATASKSKSRKNLQDTVIKGVKITKIQGLVTSNILEKLKSIYNDGKARIWGFIEGKNNDRFWNMMAEDDIILFNTDKESYGVISKVLTKEKNTSLAKELWEPDERTKKYYDRIIYLKDVRLINAPISKINKVLGYKEDFRPSHNVAFIHVNKERIISAESKYGLPFIEILKKELGISEEIPPEAGPQMIKEILDKICKQEPEFSDILKISLACLIAGKNIVFYGPPGTSKTYLAKRICEAICGEQGFRLETANAEWTNFDIIGGPVSVQEKMFLKKGIVLEAIERCEKRINNEDRPYWLIIDELNRANLDLAFGTIFTQLDIDHRDQPIKLPWNLPDIEGEITYSMPLSFRILATMNTYDRALLFSLGYAFMRRFAFIPVRSLLKEESKEKGELILSSDEIKSEINEMMKKERINKLKEIIFSAVYKHFSNKKGKDRACIFDFEIEDEDKLSQIFNKDLKIDNIGLLDILLFIASKITSAGLIEIGHAIIFDTAKFLAAFYLLSQLLQEKIDARLLLEETICSFLLPQLEYFMPKLRKGKVFGEEKYEKAWREVLDIFRKLNLKSTLKRLEEIEEEFKVMG